MRSWLIIASLLFPTALAQAEPARPPTTQVPVADTVYQFDDEQVVGDLLAPDVERVTVRKGAGRSSLIEVKTSLVRELLLSVEDM